MTWVTAMYFSLSSNVQLPYCIFRSVGAVMLRKSPENIMGFFCLFVFFKSLTVSSCSE